MDADIARWTLEFLLRHAMDDIRMNRILSILPLPNDNHRLKKMILLKTIEFEVSNGSVSENILDSIEAIVELDKSEGIAITGSIKDAYCTVTVDCTARFVREKRNEQSKFQDAVKRIWRERIPKVEKSEAVACLISDQLQNWKDEFDAAVCDASIRENILAMNTRNEALKAVRVYVAEAWKVMGPTFIELAAEKLSNLGAEARGIVNDRVSDQIEVKEREATLPSVGRDVGVGNRPAIRDEDNVGNIAASFFNAGQELSVGDRLIINDKDYFGEEETTSHRDMDVGIESAIGDNDRGEKGAESLPNIGQDSLPTTTTTDRNQRAEPSPDAPAMRDQEEATTSHRDMDVSIKSAMGDNDRGEKGGETLPNIGQDSLPTTIEHSPNAPAMRDKVETQKVNVLPKRNRSRHEKVNVLPKRNRSRHENDVPRRSLMGRNSTTHTYELNDSIDSSLSSPSHLNRFHLPSPKRKVVSPLKKYEPTKPMKFVRRRKAKKWSVLEEDTLRTGVRKYGKGNWKDILNNYRDIFEERTEVDLKDKWRNLSRS